MFEKVTLRRDNSSNSATIELTAWKVRKGWHCAPPCNSNQPVYATPRDACLAHAQNILGLKNAN